MAVRDAVMVEVGSIHDENREEESSAEPTYKQDQDDNVTQDSSGGALTIPSAIPTLPDASADEPYVGQEFESEAAAHAFYNAYAAEVGFIIRVSKLSRSRRDGTAIGRALVCNKEGYRMPDKREKIVRQRAETRVGCRAMIMMRKVNSGKWVITKFVKEHTHPLNPGSNRRDCMFEQYPSIVLEDSIRDNVKGFCSERAERDYSNGEDERLIRWLWIQARREKSQNEHDKIRELSQQLAIEKKRSVTYKRQLEVIFDYIEEHNVTLSHKIQHIVDSVKQMEPKEEEEDNH